MIERAGPPSGAGPSCTRASRQASGPTPQFTPSASTPAAVSAATATAGVVPSASTRSSPNVIDAITGTSAACRASSTASSRCSEVEERLDHQQVGAALEEAVDLLPERRPDRRLVGMAQLARGRAERADAAADPRVAARHVARLAGELRGLPVQAAGVRGEPEPRQADPVGTEGERLDQVGARVEVLAVDGRDKVGPRRRRAGILRESRRGAGVGPSGVSPELARKIRTRSNRTSWNTSLAWKSTRIPCS